MSTSNSIRRAVRYALLAGADSNSSSRHCRQARRRRR